MITDHGVIEKLSKLAQTEDELLRANLALVNIAPKIPSYSMLKSNLSCLISSISISQAISSCSDWSQNRATFGQSGAVAPLVTYLYSSRYVQKYDFQWWDASSMI